MEKIPLAERMRPTKLSEVVGQAHLIGKGMVLSEIVSSKKPVSLIFWGPPGSGKTTLARIIAEQSEAEFVELSAVTSGLADVRAVIKTAQQNRRLAISTILFVDEIHRFNKAQQDAFLPHLENGLISLIGATTENPSFEIISPLLSRSRVIVLNPINQKDMIKLLKNASKLAGASKRINSKAYELIANLADGDARVALGNLELVLQLYGGQIGTTEVTVAAQRKLPSYDKKGEQHYSIISAFIKSMRGSDVHASLYYLARMLQAGEDPKFIARRMVIFASEDIGIASSPALNLAVSTFQAVELIGLPECSYNLYHCAVVLAGAKKSRLVADAMALAKDKAEEFQNLPVPLHIRNPLTELNKSLGYGKDYQWMANFKHSQGFLPEQISDFKVW